jgi:two-component system alkaline phosphatase synthesis response regulator PhoP
MKQQRVLIVDDERPLLSNLQAYLQKEGFAVFTAEDGPSALKAARTLRPDIVVLDIMLPGMNGLEVLRTLRQASELYVLLLTARADETDKVIGLTLGADDYLTKPFSPRELVARIRAILRRGRGGEGKPQRMVFQRVSISADSRQVEKDGKAVELTPIEFELLQALARHHGRVLSREQLIEMVWGHDYYGDERVVDVHIGRLRKKVEDDPSDPKLIVTSRSVGYRFEDIPR